MLTRFNLGSIPSTAKSTLGLKIKMVRIHQICHDFLSRHSFRQGKSGFSPLFFGNLCHELARLFLRRRAVVFFGCLAWLDSNFDSQKAEVDSLLRDKLHKKRHQQRWFTAGKSALLHIS